MVAIFLTGDLEYNVGYLREKLNYGISFDILERIIEIQDNKFYLYFLDGFVKDVNMEYVRRDFYNISGEDFKKIHSASSFIEIALSSIEVEVENDIDKLIIAVLSGKTILLGPGWADAVIIDFRIYPARSVEEPDKEKVIRGSHDGFVETIVHNTALIRRRIRDPHLVFEMFSIGSVTHTDVALGYLTNKVDKMKLKQITDLIESLNIKSLTLGDQSLLESINHKGWLNPFPSTRYTERPDVVAAQIMEGDIVIVIDNTPSVLLLPSSLFDFFQSADDYYLPVFTGNYLKLLRIVVLFINVFLTPLFVLLIDNPSWVIGGPFSFLIPKDPYTIPVFVQFILAEFAVDGLKMASLNTPSALGTSLSVIGALLLGDFAVNTGWFIPQTILYMAIVALTGFVQPSIELSYAFKFIRLLMVILAGLLGLWGLIIGIIVSLAIMAATKTITGQGYLYPLIPFNGHALKHLIFRSKKHIRNKN